MKYNKNEVTGKMRDRIILQNVNRSRSLTGFASESWADTATIWAFAESKLPGSNETIIDGKNTAKNVCDFTIRYISTITEESRVVWGDKLYQVKNIKVSHDRRFISFQGVFYDSYILTGVNVAASVTGIATTSANLKLIMSVIGQANAISSAIGEIVTAQQGLVEVASSVVANGTSTANVTKVISIDSSIAASANVSAAATIVQNITSSVQAAATSTADIQLTKVLQSSVTGNATATSAIDVIQQGLVTFEASITATGTATADILRIATLASSPSTAADTSAIATLTRVLEASASATAQTSSDAQLTLAVNASASATAITTADAALSYTVNAAANATAQTNADAFITRIISAEATATANSNAEAGIGVTFVAAAVGVATSTNADLFRTATMEASATGQGTTSADSLISKLLASTVNGTASISAVLEAISSLLTISRSLRFNSADSAYLSRTPTVAGNRKTWTYSTWVKRSEINSTGGILATTTTAMSFGFNNELFFMTIAGVGNAYTTSVFRDTSAWYHVVIVFNTLESVSSNRVLIYINNINYPLNNTLVVQNTDYHINNNIVHQIGTTGITGSSTFLNSYMTEVNFIDGQALTPDSFGIRNTSTGVWSPKEYTGTYGTNGFHLNFSDNTNTTATTLGKDYSGNNNNWTPSGFSVASGSGNDSLTDVPTPYGIDNGFGGEVRGNYATLNPLDKDSEAVLTNGNLVVTGGNDGGAATFAMTTGKWYWEITLTESFNAQYWGIHGISTGKNNSYISGYPGYPLGAGIFMRNVAGTNEGGLYSNGVKLQDYILFSTDKIFGFAFDADLRTLAIYDTGTLIRAAFSVPNGLMFPSYIMNGTTGVDTSTVTYNFGQRPFTYQAPSGFKALNTANLPTPAIGGGGESNLANKYMDITTYTGTGAAQSIFNSGFKPDFVWIKSRSAATSHAIYDISRGVQKRLSSDSTNAQVTDTTGLSSFDNTGFSIGALADINTNGATYIAWQWRAGGTPVTNNGGATSSQVSVSQISGFSVVSYTGTSSATTIGHGLGVAPKMIIIKNVNNIATWAIYHDSLGSGSPQTYYLDFSNNLQSSSTAYWNSIKPTVNNFSIGVGTPSVNSSGNPFIAYCFAEIEGYSKFSSYLGNNSTDGTFVYTGFKPKYILIKCITAAGNWALYNSIVNTGDPVINELFANTTAAENSVANDDIDFLSNGFKLRSTNAAINAAQTYIYAAFAETPFKYATSK
jgi:SPP1 family predicted phage head-tail adaptor